MAWSLEVVYRVHLGAKEVDLHVSGAVLHNEMQVIGRCVLGENVLWSLEPGGGVSC